MSEPHFSVSNAGGNEADIGAAASNKKFGLVVDEGSYSIPAEYDIVAVHGISGDSKYTWGNSLGGTWFKETLFPNKSVRIMKYDYDLQASGGAIYTKKGIHDEASKLLKTLLDLRKPVALDKIAIEGETENGPRLQETRRPLVFIGHDLGAIIIKQALILADFDLSNGESIRTSTVAMICFGTPHRYRTFEDMKQSVAKLLLTNGRSDLHNLTTTVNKLSQAIVDINSFFIDSKMLLQLRMTNVFSASKDHLLQVFDEFMSTMNIPFEKRIGIDSPLQDLPRGLENNSQITGSVLDFVSYSSDVTSPLSRCSRIMLSQTPPIYPAKITSTSRPKVDLSWIDGDTTFREWLSANNTNILHVYGTSNVSMLTKFLSQYIDSWKDAPNDSSVLYFEFKKHDSRYNNLKAMFYTFLTQIISHYGQILPTTIGSNLERLLKYHSWTSKHLYNFITFLHGTKLINGIKFVVSGIELCEEDYEWFLTELAFISKNSETPFKMIIASTGRQEPLAGCLTIDLDQYQADAITQSTEPSTIVWSTMIQLIEECPQYCSFEGSLREILTEVNEEHLCHLLLEWLRFRPRSTTRSSVQKTLRNLSPATPVNILTTMMASIPTKRQPWARKVIEWITYSAHPLTIWELQGVFLDLDAADSNREEVIIQDLIEQLHEAFGGIFVLENNEVFFRHHFIREFFTTSAPSDAWYSVGNRGKSNEDITIFCLKYLSLPEIQERAAKFYCIDEKDDTEMCPVSNFRHDLVSYSAMHWPTHCKVALFEVVHPVHQSGLLANRTTLLLMGRIDERDGPEGLEPKVIVAEIDRFLGETEIRATWAKIYHLLSHPIVRSETPLSSAFVILSSLGFESFIAQKIKDGDYPQELNSEYVAAVVEAARGGHRGVIDVLLKYVEPTKAVLELAIQSADSRILSTLLKHTAKLSEKYEYSTELMCRVVWLGLDDAVEYLIEQGVQVDFEPSPSASIMSPLHLAVRMNHSKITKLLISANADLNWRALYNTTPLDTGCAVGSLESVKLLLQAKADIDCKDHNGKSLLQTAARFGQHEIIKTLISAGMDKSYPGDETQPLIKALMSGYTKCCRILLENGIATTVSSPNRPPLFWAVYQTNKEICELLLANGADPNWDSGSRHAPILVRAIQSGGSVELVELLLENGADINVVDKSSELKSSAISIAARRGFTEVTKYLIERGADVNLSGIEGATPVYFAAEANNPEIVQLLVDAKANLEMDENLNNGWGPLHVGFRFPEVVRILLQHGADITRASSGGNIMFLASRYNCPEVVKLCIQYKPDLEAKCHSSDDGAYDGATALIVAMDQGNTEVVRLLLEAGTDINQRFGPNHFPLQYGFWTEGNSDGPLRALLEYRPDLNLIDDNGSTALHCIKRETPVSWVKLLVNAGADIEIRNKDLMTPLSIAIQYRNIEVVEYLLSKKAWVNITGGLDGGPLLIACRIGDLRLVKIVVEKGFRVDVDLANPILFGTALQAACAYRPESADDDEFPMVSYLLDEAKANINAFGGYMGYALNVACLLNSTSLVKFLLKKKANPDVADSMGRKPIHFAALRTISHIDLVLNDDFLKAEDNLNRIPLHWAVLSGRVDLVKVILDRSKSILGPEVVNYPDCDGWTPLMWAARPCERWNTMINGQSEVVDFLLSNGANIFVKGRGLCQEWSPLRVATYCGASEKVIELLTPKIDDRPPRGETWNVKFHTLRKASVHPTNYCDACLLGIVGTWFRCQTCSEFDLCFKCYRSRDTLQPGCKFDEYGTEYDDDPEENIEGYDDSTSVSEIDEISDEDSEEEEPSK
ncbi:hypothetical protein NHQ30_009878 [Ciborinia camelliae]|nr:hypothetical protein NHQ30_009878 [Ciborinia camelliae]